MSKHEGWGMSEEGTARRLMLWPSNAQQSGSSRSYLFWRLGMRV